MNTQIISLLAVVLAIVTSAIVTTGSSPAQTDVVLRWKLEKGQKFRVVSDIETSVAVSKMDVHETSSKMTITTAWEVVESKDGNFKIRKTIKRVKGKVNIPFTGEIDFDTDVKDADVDAEGIAAEMVKGINALVGKKTTVEFNDRGIVKGNKEETDESNLEARGMDGGMIALMLIRFPEKSLKKGDTWEQEIEQDVPGGLSTTKNKYTYEGNIDSNKKSIHNIKIAGDLEMEAANGGVAMVMDEGSIKGILTFDVASGYLTKADMTLKMVMKTEAAGQVMTNTTTVKLNAVITRER